MTFQPRRVLVPVGAGDGEHDAQLARFAVYAACDVARAFGSDVLVLGTVPTAHASQEAREAARAHVERMRRTAALCGTVADTDVAFGHNVAREIVDAAERHEVDLILLPRPEPTGFERLLRSGVAAQVSNLTSIPLLVLRAPGSAVEGPELEPTGLLALQPDT